MDRLGIEFLTALGLPPVQFAALAGQLGCRHISFMLSGSYVNPDGYPDFDLRHDPALLRDFAAALRDHDLSISLGEGFVVQPDQHVEDFKGDLDILRALGAKRINMVSMDPDWERTLDQFALLAEMAVDAGMEQSVMEFAPILTIADLPMAVQAVEHIGRDDCRILLDTMHFARSGGTAAQLAALPEDMIGYVQLCDAPLQAVIPDYMQESMTERLSPGDGDIPLLAMLQAVPKDVTISLEVPQISHALAGVRRDDAVGAVWRAGQTMLAQLG